MHMLALLTTLLLAAAHGGGTDTAMHKHNPGFERLNYGPGATVELRGQSGALITLQGTGNQTIQWAPDDYRALDVEMRAVLVDFKPFDINAPTPIPDVRWAIRALGHGKNTYSLPLLPAILNQFAALSQFFEFSLPQRGMVERLTAKEIKLAFTAPALIGGGPTIYDTVTIAVSFMPTHSMASNSMPRQVYAPSGFLLNPFPVEAREWKLSDAFGVPFVALAQQFGILDFAAQGPVNLDPHDWADWRPVPANAVFFGSAGTDMLATFR